MSQLRALRVGLTGSLASGKTTALKTFKKQGWTVASADELVAEIYREKGLQKEDLIRKFGRSSSGIRKLEKCVHPLVKKKILALMKKSRGPLIVEVPLLFEAKFDRYFDLTIFIFAPYADRKARVVKRGMELKLFRFLDRLQLSAKEKSRRADFTVENHSKKELKKSIKLLSQILLVHRDINCFRFMPRHFRPLARR